MLIRGQTTEQRIAEIANGFGKGLDNFNQGQNQQRAQSLQDEALKRQQAMQAFEIESKLSEQTGKAVPQGTGAAVLNGMPVDFSALKAMPKTAKAEAEARKVERENLKFQQDQEEVEYKKNQRSLPIHQRDSYQEKASLLAAKNASKGGGLGLSKGEEKVDADYAKDINDWTASGKASLSKNLQSLKEARDALDSDKSLSGGLTGLLSDRFTANRVLAQRQRVGSAVQGSLKAALGTSFTEGEGNRALANSYNEAADAGTNKESLNKLITELETQSTINDQRADYFSRNGTLKGFNASTSPVSRDSVGTKQAAPVKITPQAAKKAKSMSNEELVAEAKKYGLI